MNLNTLIRSNLIIAMLGLLLLPAGVQARTTDLVNPDPVTVNCRLQPRDMQAAIRKGASVRHWKVVSEHPGRTELRYIKGHNKHVITVNVDYTRSGFSVTYKDSVNLQYFINYEGVARIHPRPVGWMKNLSGDIADAANVMCH